MDSLRISPIKPLDLYEVRRVLTSNKISDSQKAQFIRVNKTQINELMESRLTKSEFQNIMKNRPLQKFRPLKNSYTKMGDKLFLAEALGINPSEVASYVNKVSDDIKDVENLDFLPPDKLDMIKTYVYRHGSKDQVVAFLDYELTKADDKIKAIYHTMEYHTGGVADYFIRPIHRMDNKTFVQLYNVVDKHLKSALENGDINEFENQNIAEWSLIKLYKIRHNSKLINAIKTYNELKQ